MADITVENESDSAVFGRGWLKVQLQSVVVEIAKRDQLDQPMLTGDRAAIMSNESWLRVSGA